MKRGGRVFQTVSRIEVYPLFSILASRKIRGHDIIVLPPFFLARLLLGRAKYTLRHARGSDVGNNVPTYTRPLGLHGIVRFRVPYGEASRDKISSRLGEEASH